MTRPFSNNLDLNNRVLHVPSGKQGKVAVQPRDRTRMTKIIFDGRSSGQYVDVMDLRLILDGKVAEDVPPVDGEPPEKPGPNTRAPAPAGPQGSALELLRIKRGQNAHAMQALEQQFREIKAENEKIDKAIAALTA